MRRLPAYEDLHVVVALLSILYLRCLIALAAGEIDVEEAKLSILYLRCVKRVTKTVCVCRKNLSILYLRCFSEKRNPFTRCYHSFQFSI